MEKSIKRIIMAKEVAGEWIRRRSSPEYRMRIFCGSSNNLFGLLKYFRDGNVAISGLDRVKDMGIKDHFEYVEVWSCDRDGMLKLSNWLSSKNIENTGIW